MKAIVLELAKSQHFCGILFVQQLRKESTKSKLQTDNTNIFSPAQCEIGSSIGTVDTNSWSGSNCSHPK